jgi:hypothetical protein
MTVAVVIATSDQRIGLAAAVPEQRSEGAVRLG